MAGRHRHARAFLAATARGPMSNIPVEEYGNECRPQRVIWKLLGQLVKV